MHKEIAEYRNSLDFKILKLFHKCVEGSKEWGKEGSKEGRMEARKEGNTWI